MMDAILGADEWEKRWVQSKHRSDYGKFRVASGRFYGDREKDKGLKATEDTKYYAVSARFPPFNNEGQTLVLQYTVKYDQHVDCGGAYVKLYSADLVQEVMNEDSEYYIMFGPDICGEDKKIVQVIFNYKDDYYLIKKNITCEDWDQPERIPDPNVTKPDDWDEEMDGEWAPPSVPNPEYRGIWKPRIIKNPNYNGIWVQPLVDNPEYTPDPNLYKYFNISVIGLEILQGKSGTIFDNFLITNDEQYAEDAGNEMWGPTFEREWKRRQGQDVVYQKINENEEPKGKEGKKEKRKKKDRNVKDEL
uniref:calreticulin-like isoform X3 n=1 Tax=Podarcis muralis TaxID=64176 RepID=UPI0010A0032F|nr:calreticulin-like isoform X3 [Podarcis muralis]